MTASLPNWAQELARTYQGGAVNTFLLYGNVNDSETLHDGHGVSFVSLKEFLERALFPQREALICYDQAAGIWFPRNEMREDFLKVIKAADDENLPRDPSRALPLIERYLRTRLLDNAGFGAAVAIDYANFITQNEASSLITLHKWSSDPVFTRADITVVLICENLADLHPMLVRSPNTAKIQLPLPELNERLEYLNTSVAPEELARISPLSAEEIAIHTAGLSRVNLDQLVARGKILTAESAKLARTRGKKAAPAEEGFCFPSLDLDALFDEKKALLEKECFGLLEFIRPKRGLETVSGHEAAKAWLTEDARLFKEGKHDALPMGYLICGPVGTGKTYLMTSYAATLGIPCVKLLNLRATEGNWEKILNTLKAAAPVAVIIDAADAALGNVSSLLAQQIADTHYRGRILWFVLTCRPDLIPADLKLEIHIPLFYPDSDDEKRNYFTIQARKNGGTLDAEDVPTEALKLTLSGADIEGLVIRAKRRGLLGGSATVRTEDLTAVLQNFLPANNAEEIELQTLAAVVECTHQDFLPAPYRKLDRGEAARRFAVLKEKRA